MGDTTFSVDKAKEMLENYLKEMGLNVVRYLEVSKPLEDDGVEYFNITVEKSDGEIDTYQVFKNGSVNKMPRAVL